VGIAAEFLIFGIFGAATMTAAAYTFLSLL
jgi:hypothetical protein